MSLTSNLFQTSIPRFLLIFYHFSLLFSWINSQISPFKSPRSLIFSQIQFCPNGHSKTKCGLKSLNLHKPLFGLLMKSTFLIFFILTLHFTFIFNSFHFIYILSSFMTLRSPFDIFTKFIWLPIKFPGCIFFCSLNLNSGKNSFTLFYTLNMFLNC